MEPQVDHVVVDVQDRIEEARRRYASLGFRLTERGRHTMGSVNHLAMFGSDYLELLGTGEPGGTPRADLAGFPIGLNGLVFKTANAAQRHTELLQRGIPVQPVQSFSRPVRIEGRGEEARFNTVHLPPRMVFDGRVYFCQHLTPQWVWRPEWQEHPNGAMAIARIVIAARDPAQVSGWFPRLLGQVVPRADDSGMHATLVDKVRIEIVPHDSLLRQVGEAAPDPAGRSDYMALLGIQVRSLQRAEETLRSGGIRAVSKEEGRLLVHPKEAMNVALEFSA